MLSVKDLRVTLGGADVLKSVSLEARAGEWLMIVGPNGAGKSTLLGAIAQTVAHTGTVQINGKDARAMKPAALARRLGVLSQHNSVGYAFTVEDIVRMGRYAYSPRLFSRRAQDDELIISEAIALTGLEAIRGQSVLTLSGGELQRAFLAQLFAQDPPLLLLDEPGNHLDMPYQRQVFELLREWMRERNRAIVSVVHDLSLARAYGTHALLLCEGRAAAFGAIAETLTRERLNAVYGMDVYGWLRKLMSAWEDM